MNFKSLLNKHQGERFFIGGASPYFHTLNASALNTGVVIGLNDWCSRAKADYLMLYDSFVLMEEVEEWKGYLDYWKSAKATKLARRDPEVLATVGVDASDYWYIPIHHKAEGFQDAYEYEEQFHYLRLCHQSTVATEAMHLAVRMGASEIILYAVDLIGDSRADGTDYPHKDFWGEHIFRVQDFIDSLGIPVYKTNPDSPLKIPCYHW